MDQPSSWPRQLTPPSLPARGWQRQGSSLSVKALHDSDHGVREPQAASQTPAQKLIAGLDPAKIQEVAASQVAISEMYYTTSLHHAQRLFRWALMTAGVALVFFLVAVASQVLQKSVNGALISLASGGVFAAIAVLNFWLYGRIFHQFRAFDERLDRTQQYLLANSICEHLQGEVKQATQIELIRAMMHSLTVQEEKMAKGRGT
jgi:hypothetical protein